ncbi:SRPBCC family protein [Sorangium sp. So ce302]|uniref:aromatase/cyclase n=1 Tax=Sorangium sp. So ce302 TaxID=3133297 RepID=UPI003F62BCD2
MNTRDRNLQMNFYQHTIEVAADVNDAYALSAEVEAWPQIFPPCKGVRVIERTDSSQLVEITALANGKLMTWRSTRELFPEQRAISFRQVQPSPLLRSMEGSWRFFPVQTGTLIVLEHRFEIKPDVRGLVDGVSTPEEALSFMSKSTDTNSKRELQAIKQALESRTFQGLQSELYGEFQEEMVIAASPEAVYSLLARAQDWPQVLSHCHDVEMRYDDGQHQEFIMTVDVKGQMEQIRSIRRCTPHASISYFQPEPPPALRRHSGKWLIERVPGGVRVVSWHAVELRPDGMKQVWGDISPGDALARVTKAINDNSRGTMLAIKGRTAEQAQGRSS